MTANLDGIRIKLKRAYAHAKELKALLDPISERATHSIRPEVDASANKIVYRVMDIPAIPDDASAVVGDILHNLRSAIDHLAWQLVVLDGHRDPTQDTQFPIYEFRNNANGRPHGIDIQPGVKRRDILTALKEVQPYEAGDPWESVLWPIHQLNIADKHRDLLTMAGGVSWDPGPYWGNLEGQTVVAFTFHVGVPLESGDEVASLTYAAAPPDPADVDLHVSVAVALDEGPQVVPGEDPSFKIRAGSADQAAMRLLDGVVFTLNAHFIELFPERPFAPFR